MNILVGCILALLLTGLCFLVWLFENFGFFGNLTYKSLWITIPSAVVFFFYVITK